MPAVPAPPGAVRSPGLSCPNMWSLPRLRLAGHRSCQPASHPQGLGSDVSRAELTATTLATFLRGAITPPGAVPASVQQTREFPPAHLAPLLDERLAPRVLRSFLRSRFHFFLPHPEHLYSPVVTISYLFLFCFRALLISRADFLALDFARRAVLSACRADLVASLS